MERSVESVQICWCGHTVTMAPVVIASIEPKTVDFSKVGTQHAVLTFTYREALVKT
jgi:hypothetical protein